MSRCQPVEGQRLQKSGSERRGGGEKREKKPLSKEESEDKLRGEGGKREDGSENPNKDKSGSVQRNLQTCLWVLDPLDG